MKVIKWLLSSLMIEMRGHKKITSKVWYSEILPALDVIQKAINKL